MAASANVSVESDAKKPQELPELSFSFAQEGICDLLKPLEEQKSNLGL